MSEEKVLTLRGKKAVWAPGGGSGPIDPKRLPEGYPYKNVERVEVFNESVTPSDTMQGLCVASVVTDFVPTAGTVYAVNFNGVEYETIGTDGGGLGNMDIAMGGYDGTGCPFIMGPQYNKEGVLQVIWPETVGDTATVVVSADLPVYSPMDDNYLSDNVGRQKNIGLIAKKDGATGTYTYTPTVSYDEAYTCIGNGIGLVATIVGDYGTTFIHCVGEDAYRNLVFMGLTHTYGSDLAYLISAIFRTNGTFEVHNPKTVGFSNKAGDIIVNNKSLSDALNAGVGGNNREFIIDVGDGFSSATTYADVLAAIKAGKCPIAYWNAGGSLLKSYGYMVSEADGAVGFVFFHAGSQIGIAVTESGWGAQ